MIKTLKHLSHTLRTSVKRKSVFKKNITTKTLTGISYCLLAYSFASQSALAQTTTSSSRLSDTDRIIVKYKNSTVLQRLSARNRALVNLSSRAGSHLNFFRHMATGANVLKLDRKYRRGELSSLLQRLRQDPNIEYAEADLMMQPSFIPNDQFYDLQWHYFETAGGINVEDAWDINTGEGVVVAVLDTGYTEHVDLAGNILPGYDMISDDFVGNDGDGRDSDALDAGDWVTAGACGDGKPETDIDSSWHGTHVAGTIAAVTNNNVGVAGIAFNAQVVPVRVLGRCGGFTSDIADGIVWAAGGNVSGAPSNNNPAQVINLSLGGIGSCGNTTQNAINTARSLGATVVVAAGNDAINAANATPANCDGVVSVAATNRDGGRSYFSNFGNVVDLAAPGGDVRSNAANGIGSTLNEGTTVPTSGNYVYYQGTSMAAPHVAGVAALLYSENPNLTPDEVETILTESARSFPASCSGCGAGILDAAAALAALENPTETEGGGFIIDDISGSRRSWQYTTVDIPSGTTNLTVSINGGSGDADLYVRYGSRPSTRRYNCRPYESGNNEICSFSNPSSGTWHIGLRGYSAYSGLTLVVSYE